MITKETEVMESAAMPTAAPGKDANQEAAAVNRARLGAARLAAGAARSKTPAMLVLGLAGALAGMLALGIVPRLNREKRIQAAAQEVQNSVPAVQFITAQRASSSVGLTLPGNIEAIQVTTLSARTSGYLRNWYVDMGDKEHAGDVLAFLDAPEAMQDVDQARSTLTQAR